MIFVLNIQMDHAASITSIHDHVVSHPEVVVQDAPELAPVQTGSGFLGEARLPHERVKLPDEATYLRFTDWAFKQLRVNDRN